MKVVQFLLVAFVMVEFVPYHEQRVILDSFFLVIFTMHGILIDYAHGNPFSWQTANRWSTMFFVWLLWICGAATGNSLISGARPCVLFSKNHGVRVMFKLMWRCVYSARHIIGLCLCVVAVTAIMTSLLEFDAKTSGQTKGNFLDSYVAMFVFMVSLENYGLVYQQQTDGAAFSWVYFTAGSGVPCRVGQCCCRLLVGWKESMALANKKGLENTFLLQILLINMESFSPWNRQLHT